MTVDTLDAGRPRPFVQAETEEEARARRMHNMAVRMNTEPPRGHANLTQIVMWRRCIPRDLKLSVAELIARGALTWDDVFQDGNVVWAIRPIIGWRFLPEAQAYLVKVQRAFEDMAKAKAEGVANLMPTHRMDEVQAEHVRAWEAELEAECDAHDKADAERTAQVQRALADGTIEALMHDPRLRSIRQRYDARYDAERKVDAALELARMPAALHRAVAHQRQHAHCADRQRVTMQDLAVAHLKWQPAREQLVQMALGEPIALTDEQRARRPLGAQHDEDHDSAAGGANDDTAGAGADAAVGAEGRVACGSAEAAPAGAADGAATGGGGGGGGSSLFAELDLVMAAAGVDGLTPYEVARAAQIKANRLKMVQLGLVSPAEPGGSLLVGQPVNAKRTRAQLHTGERRTAAEARNAARELFTELRRSGRPTGKPVKYTPSVFPSRAAAPSDDSDGNGSSESDSEGGDGSEAAARRRGTRSSSDGDGTSSSSDGESDDDSSEGSDDSAAQPRRGARATRIGGASARKRGAAACATSSAARAAAAAAGGGARARGGGSERKPVLGRALQCPHPGCAWTFDIKHVLEEHIRTHTGEKPFACTVAGCGQAFAKSGDLTTHIRTHTGEKPFACTVAGCGQAFATSSHLTEHIRTHTGEKPFACTVAGCGQAFAKSGDLTKHIRTHTGEKPFACTVAGCGQAFAQSSHLTKHIRTHTREKPFACTVAGCGQAFATSSHLTTHIRTHTGEKPFACTVAGCGQAFATSSHLTAHVRRKHTAR
ncbi:hypothetical protein KFE25_000306 [Diacronema lutheri]|uniref:C2H2-type domain-containing protein n=1 Tax=Diacronema lutheri TaxID=2081491 RepID=A0A8J6CE31_DIALT|nr:hypothetical protein KFE25_010444 [Diacronema lutheri]KAG8464138.1 hypothetical protein KFE25_000306 [Diacronema lutheri]